MRERESMLLTDDRVGVACIFAQGIGEQSIGEEGG